MRFPAIRPLSFTVVCLLAWAPGARAQDEEDPAPGQSAGSAPNRVTSDPALDAFEDTAKKKKKKKKDAAAEPDSAAADPAADEKPAIEFRGRAMAQAAYEEETLRNAAGVSFDRQVLDLDVPSARLSVRARIIKNVTAVVEGEFARRNVLRDGYVQYRSKRFAVRAGRFKMPISSFQLESPWTLPVARRGALHQHLANDLAIIGRRTGFMAQVKGGGYLDPALTVGVFQPAQLIGQRPNARGVYGIDRDDPLENPRVKDQTLVARASVTPSGIEVAGVGQIRSTRFQAEQQREATLWLAGGDLHAEFETERFGFRFWAEAFYGTSILNETPYDASKSNFSTARALAAFRIGGIQKGDRYFEVFGSGGYLEPDADFKDDIYWELLAGFNIGHWKQTRANLQFEYGKAGRNFNISQQFSRGPDLQDDVLTNRAVIFELGAAF